MENRGILRIIAVRQPSPVVLRGKLVWIKLKVREGEEGIVKKTWYRATCWATCMHGRYCAIELMGPVFCSIFFSQFLSNEWLLAGLTYSVTLSHFGQCIRLKIMLFCIFFTLTCLMEGWEVGGWGYVLCHSQFLGLLKDVIVWTFRPL